MGNDGARSVRRRKEVGPIHVNENGTFSINLQEHERETLLRFVEELESLLAQGKDNKNLARLFPVAYNNNPDFNDEYQKYMTEELAQSRAASIQMVREVLTSNEPMTEQQAMAFASVLNNLRLVLGAILDVSESHDFDEIDEDDPLFDHWQLYGYLGWLLEWTVSAISGE